MFTQILFLLKVGTARYRYGVGGVSLFKEEGLANFFYKGSDSKYFRLGGHRFSVATT